MRYARKAHVSREIHFGLALDCPFNCLVAVNNLTAILAKALFQFIEFNR